METAIIHFVVSAVGAVIVGVFHHVNDGRDYHPRYWQQFLACVVGGVTKVQNNETKLQKVNERNTYILGAGL